MLTKMKFTKVIYETLYLLFIVQRNFLHISIQKILKQFPKIKTFQNVLRSSTVFHSGIFYKVLNYSIGKFFNIRESSRLFLFLLDSSIYIIEQCTNFKYIKYQEKQITFKNEYFHVIDHPP